MGIAERHGIQRLGDAEGLVASAEVAGPGFVNVRLTDARWHDLLRQVLDDVASAARATSIDLAEGEALSAEVTLEAPAG